MLHMDEYLLELDNIGRKTDYTRKVKAGLSYFTTFLRNAGVDHPDQIERAHLLQFQAWLGRQDWKRSYQNQQMKYVRGWLNWMEAVHYLTEENPWYRIRVGQVGKVPNPLSDDEIAMLFDAHRQDAFRIPPFHYHRREIIMTLLYAWGLRIHELQSLNMTAMDTRLDYVTCINKGGRNKHLPYDDVLKQVFVRYSTVRSKYARLGEDALIIDNTGKRLSINRIRQIVVELGERCGLDIHPHQLRDTAGTHLLDDDVPVERVMKILGHTRREQTLAYARVNDHKVAESHRKSMSPRLRKLLAREINVPF